LLGAPKPGHVDGQKHVRRTGSTLGLDALEKRIFSALDAVDFDTG